MANANPKSWSELTCEVRNFRRKFCANNGPRFPHSFTFRRMSGDKTRIYFMSSLADSRENSIFAIDIPDGPSMEEDISTATGVFGVDFLENSHASWLKIFSPSTMLTGAPTKEEQLIMERKRMNPKGISEYDFDVRSSMFLISTGSSLYKAYDNNELPLNPIEIPTSTFGARINAEYCVHNPNIIAFINNNDLWVVNSESGDEVRLTFTRSNDPTSESTRTAGFPTYVMQEEFSRFTGFWWQQATPINDKGIYRILYEENEEKEVGQVKLLNLPGRESENYRFPIAGSKNATSIFKIVEFKLEEDGKITVISNQELSVKIHELFPWVEYIVRAGWTPDGKYIWFQLLDRKQQRLELVLYPLKSSLGRLAHPHVIYSENTTNWINVNDILTFLPSSDPSNSVSFIWGSEESGFNHLYLIKSELRPALDERNVDDSPLLCLSPNILSKVQLTKGDWEVVNEGIRVDMNKLPELIVFFTALADSPLERHLYVVSASQPGHIKRLTQLGHSYTCIVNADCSLLIASYSSIKESPVCKIFKIKYESSLNSVQNISIEPLVLLMKSQEINMNFSIPEIMSYRLDTGQDIYGMIFRPIDFDPEKKYPTVLHVYGGPEVQLIHNTFRGSGQLWIHLLASLGYIVICIDSRGSAHRGVEFEAHIRKRMGTVELKDQVEMLGWLVNERKYIDPNRIAIYGWSYGGYLSLLGLAFYPEIFKLAIAGAPVTSWQMYDTGYTERYMERPQDNLKGYGEGSVLTYVDRFPDEQNRLLIVHGLVDENVHFTHTAMFIDALIRAGKPYELQLYPNERHSLRRLEASEHFESTFVSYLQKNL